MKIMISQPMAGLTRDEILAKRQEIVRVLELRGHTVINSFFSEEFEKVDSFNHADVKHKSLCFLSKSIDKMSLCDAIYFVSGWQDARGCRIEREIAEAYGLTLMYEEE